MKKKILIRLFLVLYVIMICVGIKDVNAELGGALNTDIYEQVTEETETDLDETLYTISSTMITILQIAGMAGVVFIGVKYMMAGADSKAELKQALIWVVIGTVFVFVAPFVINLIIDTSENLLPT